MLRKNKRFRDRGHVDVHHDEAISQNLHKMMALDDALRMQLVQIPSYMRGSTSQLAQQQ